MLLKDLDDENIDSAIYHLWGSPGGIYGYRRIRNWIHPQSCTFIVKFYNQADETKVIWQKRNQYYFSVSLKRYCNFTSLENIQTKVSQMLEVGYTDCWTYWKTSHLWTAPSKNVSSKIHRLRFNPRMDKVSFGPLLSIDTFSSVQWSVRGQWRPWSDRADEQADLGLQLSAYTRRHLL